MLSIGKIGNGKGSGTAIYYTRSVADGVEDYYAGQGETPGYWAGTGADRLGLNGRVDSDKFLALMDGAHPDQPILRLYAGSGRQVQAFDATFSAPKSVSLMWALADPAVSTQVVAAHETAVAAGLSYLEQHASHVRVGRNGVDRADSQGFVAAVFRHRTSRAGDPALHSHVVIANMVETIADGKWRTIDGRTLYGEAKTAGMIYQSQLRQELGLRLGVRFEVKANGLSEIVGFERHHIDAFSKRRTEIVDAIDQAGGDLTRAQRETITLATRQPKTGVDAIGGETGQRSRDYGIEPDQLRARWAAEADLHGLTRDAIAAHLNRVEYVLPTGTELAELAQHLESPRGLTKEDSTFTRREVTQAFARDITQGLDPASIERLTDTFLTGQDIIHTLTPAILVETEPAQGRDLTPERRYSTVEMLQTEARVLDHATNRTNANIAVLPADAVETFIAANSSTGLAVGMKQDQANLIRTIATSGNGLDVVQAHAGTGKTWAFGRLAELYTQHGYHVIGLTTARTAAQELGAEGINAHTIAQLIHDTARGDPLPQPCLVLIDEAGMVSTRDWDRLLPHLNSAKIVAAGDTNQLPEIDAGGVFAGLQTRLPTIQLTEVIRQRDPNEIVALQHIRDRDIAPALDYYTQHDRIIVRHDAVETRRRIVADWAQWTSTVNPETGRPYQVLVIAARNSTVNELNLDLRAQAQHNHRLSGQPITLPTEHGPRPFQIGDRIRPTANWNARNITNNAYGTITHINHQTTEISYQTDKGDTVLLPEAYLTKGRIDYGYARTAHKAQGTTTDVTLHWGDPHTHNELLYTALSRNRHTNTTYLTTPPAPLLDTPHPPNHPTRQLVEAGARSRSKTLARDISPGLKR